MFTPTFGFTLRWQDGRDEDSYLAVEVREQLCWYRWSHLTENTQREVLATQTVDEFLQNGAPFLVPSTIAANLRTRLISP